MDIMGMMECFTADRERGRLLAQPTHLVILLGVVLTMLHRNSFLRKLLWPLHLFLLKLVFIRFAFRCMLSFVYCLFCILKIVLYFAFHVYGRKNGAVVGTAYKELKVSLFPTIAVHSQNEEYVYLLQNKLLLS